MIPSHHRTIYEHNTERCTHDVTCMQYVQLHELQNAKQRVNIFIFQGWARHVYDTNLNYVDT